MFSSSLFAASKDLRGEKSHELTLQGGFDYRFFTYQVGYMYFLNADQLIGLKVGSNRSHEEGQTNISLQFQNYLGNSFYIAPEVFYLNTHENINGFIDNIFRLGDRADHTSMGAGIRIGNQWTFKLATIGCDWIGLGQRFGTFEKESDKLDDTTFTLLNVKFGVSF